MGSSSRRAVATKATLTEKALHTKKPKSTLPKKVDRKILLLSSIDVGQMDRPTFEKIFCACLTMQTNTPSDIRRGYQENSGKLYTPVDDATVC